MNDEPRSDRQKEINQNFEYFVRELPNILPTRKGKFALLRHQKIVNYYDTVADAVNAGNQSYEDKIFSVQQVIDDSTDLGYYSYAVPLGAAQ